ncbi:MAG: hypothetical protein ACR2HG_01390 [Pyrinomonadaceae bacterium]
MPQNAWTLSYQDVMGLCRLAYVNRSDAGGIYMLAGREWRVSTIYNAGPFRAILAEGKDLQNNNTRVLSFSGSDIEWGDWNHRGNFGNAMMGADNTEQYQVGLNLARQVRPTYYTGHSLGGGIALYSCVNTSIRAATINPSPLFNDVFGTQYNKYNNTPWAINYCVNYEMLAAGRNTAAVGAFGFAAGATPGTRVTVGSLSKDPYNRHLLANLEGFSEPVKKN